MRGVPPEFAGGGSPCARAINASAENSTNAPTALRHESLSPWFFAAEKGVLVTPMLDLARNGPGLHRIASHRMAWHGMAPLLDHIGRGTHHSLIHIHQVRDVYV
jgi:hypothetical protein